MSGVFPPPCRGECVVSKGVETQRFRQTYRPLLTLLRLAYCYHAVVIQQGVGRTQHPRLGLYEPREKTSMGTVQMGGCFNQGARRMNRHRPGEHSCSKRMSCHLTWSRGDGPGFLRLGRVWLPPPLSPRCRFYPAPLHPHPCPFAYRRGPQRDCCSPISAPCASPSRRGAARSAHRCRYRHGLRGTPSWCQSWRDRRTTLAWSSGAGFGPDARIAPALSETTPAPGETHRPDQYMAAAARIGGASLGALSSNLGRDRRGAIPVVLLFLFSWVEVRQ